MIWYRKIYSLAQKIIEKRLRIVNRNNAKILMFHDVSSAEKFSDRIDDLSIEYRFSPLSDVVTADGRLGDRVYLTFDDGYESVYTKVYPMLKKRKAPFTVFVVVDFIGRKGYLNEKQLRELAKDDLVTIGAHTYTHPLLRLCDDEQKFHEIVDAKKDLEILVGSRINSFAFPYGSVYAVDKQSLKIAAENYEMVLTTISSPLSSMVDVDLKKMSRIDQGNF